MFVEGGPFAKVMPGRGTKGPWAVLVQHPQLGKDFEAWVSNTAPFETVFSNIFGYYFPMLR